MGYIVGEDRAQASFLPARLEDYVAADAAVRVIDAFADGLDLTVLASAGRCLRRPVGPATIRVIS
jgi:hypothetical protein